MESLFCFSCSNLDNGSQEEPRAMVNLETWLPPDYQVEDSGWKIKDVGSLGAGGRMGWFIPAAFASQSPPITDHWRAFKNPQVASQFALSASDLEAVKEMTVDTRPSAGGR